MAALDGFAEFVKVRNPHWTVRCQACRICHHGLQDGLEINGFRPI